MFKRFRVRAQGVQGKRGLGSRMCLGGLGFRA